MNKSKKLKSKNLTKNSINILVSIFLGISLAASVYYWKQLEINNLMNDKQKLTTENNNLSTKNTELKSLADLVSKTNEALSNQKYKSTNKKVQIEIYTPLSGTKVTSPLIISGRVPGSWSFEASFPISIQDSSGKVIAQNIAQLTGDWMTSELVPFTSTLSWTENKATNGFLVLRNDNPSGLKEKEDTLSIPINF